MNLQDFKEFKFQLKKFPLPQPSYWVLQSHTYLGARTLWYSGSQLAQTEYGAEILPRRQTEQKIFEKLFMVILFNLRVDIKYQLRKHFFVFRVVGDAWTVVCTEPLRLISQDTTYWTLAMYISASILIFCYSRVFKESNYKIWNYKKYLKCCCWFQQKHLALPDWWIFT